MLHSLLPLYGQPATRPPVRLDKLHDWSDPSGLTIRSHESELLAGTESSLPVDPFLQSPFSPFSDLLPNYQISPAVLSEGTFTQT